MATRSRQWATKPIKECIQKGFVLNDEMLKNGKTCGMFYDTEGVSADALSLKLDGLNHNDVYENVVHQITGGRLSTSETLAEAVNRDKYIQKLERDIVALQNKIQNEKQFNKQVELNGELKRLEKILEELE